MYFYCNIINPIRSKVYRPNKLTQFKRRNEIKFVNKLFYCTSSFVELNETVKSNNNTLKKHPQRKYTEKVDKYNRRLHILFRTGRIKDMFVVCEEMRKKNIKFNIYTYNWLLCAFDANRSPSKSLMALEEMIENNITPSHASYSIIFNTLSTTQNISKAIELYKDMLDRGIKPDIININSLLSVCYKAKNGNFALKLMEDIEKFKLNPTLETYCNFLESLCDGNHNDILFGWLKKVDDIFKKKDTYIPVSIREQIALQFLYNDILDGLEYLIDFDISRKVTIETGFLRRVLESIARSNTNNIHFAEKIYNLLESRNAVSNSVLSSMLIIYMKNDIYIGFLHLGRYIERGFKLHQTLFYILSNIIGFNNKRVDEGFYMIEKLYKEGEKIPAESFNLIIYNCSEMGDYDQSYGTYLEMKNFDVIPNHETFSALLHKNRDHLFRDTIIKEAIKMNINI